MELRNWDMSEYPRDVTWARGRLHSLVVCSGGKEQELTAPDSGKGANNVFIRALQLLVANNIVGLDWLLEFCESKQYGFRPDVLKRKLEASSEESPEKRYTNLHDKTFPNLPDFYFFTSINSDVAKYGNSSLPVRMQKIAQAILAEKQDPTMKLVMKYSSAGKGISADETGTAEVSDDMENAETEEYRTDIGLNTILYGPPGTGKTYYTRYYAVAAAKGETLEEVERDYPNYGELADAYRKLEKDRRIRMVTFHQSYGYEDFIQGICPVMTKKDEPSELAYRVREGVFTEFCNIAKDDPDHNYVFIIDEINRGNIAKIFGELITLIEPGKRGGQEEEIRVRLPYTQDPDEEMFYVPRNVYLLGTMNTADRSLALLDTALRRRFEFEEMLPAPELLDGVKVNNIDIRRLLERMNEKLELLLDREHTIGHAFFMDLKREPSMKLLARIMRYKVVPLLQEFFYDDYSMLQLILGDRIVRKKVNGKLRETLESQLPGHQLPEQYEIRWQALEEAASYLRLMGLKTVDDALISDESEEVLEAAEENA